MQRLVHDCPAARRQAHTNPAAIVRITITLDETLRFEMIDPCRHCAGREQRRAGKLGSG
jgi:hypothetical protein